MESITGYVEHIVFQNSENGYTVMILMMEGEEVTCVGMCKGLGQGCLLYTSDAADVLLV